MKIYLKLAIRNLLRHTRRSMVCLIMIVGAFCALVIFSGFSEEILQSLSAIAIDSMYGHVQLARHEFFNHIPMKLAREVYLKNPTGLKEDLRKIPEVENVSGRLEFYALISTQDLSVSAKGVGFEVAEEPRFSTNLHFDSGKPLDEKSDREIVIGSGLNQALHAKPGDRVTLVSSTLDGTVNAVDVIVKGVYSMGVSEVDDSVFFMPAQAAQHLMDADSFQNLIVRLKPGTTLSSAVAHIQKIAAPNGLEVKTWHDLSILFQQVESFWHTQSVMILSILSLLIFLGIANTVSMSIVERTAEIGTLRAIGFEKRDLMRIFLLEFVVMGLVGVVIAVPASLVAVVAINALKIPLLLPASSVPFPIKIILTTKGYTEGVLVAILVPVLAAYPTLRLTLKRPIVDSLRTGV